MAIGENMIRGTCHETTMRPVILGWIEQKYSYAPGASKRRENCSSVSSTRDLNFCSVLTTLWGTSSRFVQVMVVPTGTDAVGGLKLKLSITTSWPVAVCVSSSSGTSVIAIGWFTPCNDTRDRPSTFRSRSSATFIGPGDAAVPGA